MDSDSTRANLQLEDNRREKKATLGKHLQRAPAVRMEGIAGSYGFSGPWWSYFFKILNCNSLPGLNLPGAFQRHPLTSEDTGAELT